MWSRISTGRDRRRESFMLAVQCCVCQRSGWRLKHNFRAQEAIIIYQLPQLTFLVFPTQITLSSVRCLLALVLHWRIQQFIDRLSDRGYPTVRYRYMGKSRLNKMWIGWHFGRRIVKRLANSQWAQRTLQPKENGKSRMDIRNHYLTANDRLRKMPKRRLEKA